MGTNRKACGINDECVLSQAHHWRQGGRRSSEAFCGGYLATNQWEQRQTHGCNGINDCAHTLIVGVREEEVEGERSSREDSAGRSTAIW